MSDEPRYAARTAWLAAKKPGDQARILVQQTIWKRKSGNPKDPGAFVIDTTGKGRHEIHKHVTDVLGIGQAVLDAHAGRL